MKKIFPLFLSLLLILTPACNKKAIEALQDRLDQLENSTLVSINSQISSMKATLEVMQDTEKQLGDYIRILEEKDASLQDIVNALKEQDGQLSAELTALRADFDASASDVQRWLEQAAEMLERFNAVESQFSTIQEYIDSVKSRLTGLEEKTDNLSASLVDCQTQIQEIKEALQTVQEDIQDIREQIQALVNSVQSVVAVPDYSDGSVEIGNRTDNSVAFEVFPLTAADLLAQLGASAVSLDAVETKAGDRESIKLPVSATRFDGTFFIVTVDGSGLSREVKQGEVSLNARLLISDGVVTRTSDYFPLAVFVDPALETYTFTADPVDLGLSVKWSAYNLGADSPEGYGAIYAWGETETKAEFSWKTYKWCDGVENSLNKYCTDEKYGTVDDKTVLEPEDDVAHVKLGGSWRMPTREEAAELLTACKWTWTGNYKDTGVSGFIVSGLAEGFEDKSIFLPTAGYIGNVGPQYAGYNGSYWSSTLSNPVNPIFIYCLGFDFLGPNEGGGYRFHGRSVRPVTE